MTSSTFARRLALACLLLAAPLAACGGDDDGGGGGGGDACTGDITTCPLPDLSATQKASFCDTLLAAIDDGPGTTYECEETGLFLTVNDRASCIATEYAAGCPVTGGDLIDCYKAAADDACEAFGESGGCAIVFENAADCVGG